MVSHFLQYNQYHSYSGISGLMAGSVIGLPPVLNFGSPAIKAKVIPDVLSGEKLICLAISEAFAGSDVSGLKTTAKKTADGKHWIIDGTLVTLFLNQST
jgi:alkylation response protein AidB-like acyl-CoA dehydrogenase